MARNPNKTDSESETLPVYKNIITADANSRLAPENHPQFGESAKSKSITYRKLNCKQ